MTMPEQHPDMQAFSTEQMAKDQLAIAQDYMKQAVAQLGAYPGSNGNKPNPARRLSHVLSAQQFQNSFIGATEVQPYYNIIQKEQKNLDNLKQRCAKDGSPQIEQKLASAQIHLKNSENFFNLNKNGITQIYVPKAAAERMSAKDMSTHLAARFDKMSFDMIRTLANPNSAIKSGVLKQLGILIPPGLKTMQEKQLETRQRNSSFMSVPGMELKPSFAN